MPVYVYEILKSGYFVGRVTSTSAEQAIKDYTKKHNTSSLELTATRTY